MRRVHIDPDMSKFAVELQFGELVCHYSDSGQHEWVDSDEHESGRKCKHCECDPEYLIHNFLEQIL